MLQLNVYSMSVNQSSKDWCWECPGSSWKIRPNHWWPRCFSSIYCRFQSQYLWLCHSNCITCNPQYRIRAIWSSAATALPSCLPACLPGDGKQSQRCRGIKRTSQRQWETWQGIIIVCFDSIIVNNEAFPPLRLSAEMLWETAGLMLRTSPEDAEDGKHTSLLTEMFLYNGTYSHAHNNTLAWQVKPSNPHTNTHRKHVQTKTVVSLREEACCYPHRLYLGRSLWYINYWWFIFSDTF